MTQLDVFLEPQGGRASIEDLLEQAVTGSNRTSPAADAKYRHMLLEAVTSSMARLEDRVSREGRTFRHRTRVPSLWCDRWRWAISRPA